MLLHQADDNIKLKLLMTLLKMLFALAESGLSQPTAPLLSLFFAIGLALIHLYSGKLLILDQIPRSRWLSMAGGVSVAYVFVHLLPDLNEHQIIILQTGVLGFLEHHVYLIALIGLAVFYGLERLVKQSQKQQSDKFLSEPHETADLGVFWLHIISFSLYNGLIGYLLLHREETDLKSLFLFFIAMGLHFVVNDYGLRQDHKRTYHHVGRWILAGAIIVGWAIGQATEISEAILALLFAFLAGGIILNVMKEELPEERQSRFWAFAVGALGYSVILLTL